MSLTRRDAAALFLAAAAAPAALAKPAGRTTISADGVEIAYETAGRGRTTLVFVHGWCCDRSYWDAQWPDFARTHRVVRLDLAGHGASGRGRKNYTMAAFGADVAAVVAAANVRGPFAIVGHSMGGPVALAAATLVKGDLRGLVGVDTYQVVGQPAPTTAALAALEGQLAPFRADFKAASAGFVRSQFFSPQSDPKLVERIVSGMSSADPAMGVSAIVGMSSLDHLALLKTLSPLPIHAINAPGTVKDFAAARAQYSAFEETVLPGTKHFLHVEEPARFNAALSGVVGRMLAG